MWWQIAELREAKTIGPFKEKYCDTEEKEERVRKKEKNKGEREKEEKKKS